jgi:hypothetical protein
LYRENLEIEGTGFVQLKKWSFSVLTNIISYNIF